jgi:hypothetical protein
MSTNPLAKHFRTPSLYIKLPSEGRWWPEGSLELPITGEIGILPMTTRDEIVLRTPDVLMNGEGVVKVIESCCPNIKNAWNMPSVDVDAVLIAIRIASYGENMSVSGDCPACKESNDYDINLHELRASMGKPEFNIVESCGLKIQLKPQEYFGVNEANTLKFEEQRLLQLLVNDSITEEQKEVMFKENLSKLVDMNLKIVTDSTEFIETGDGTRATEKEHIREFYENANRAILADIKRYLAEVKEQMEIKPVKVRCGHCDHENQLTVEFNYSDFFDPGS